MKGFSMGVTTAYMTEALMSLSLDSNDENKETLASVLSYNDTTKRCNLQVEQTLRSLLVEETHSNRGPCTNIWDQDTAQRQDKKFSSHRKDDQLIEGGVWAAQLQEGSEVTEEVGDGVVSTERQLYWEEGV